MVVSHTLCWCGFAGLPLPRPFGRLWPGFPFAVPAVETFIILSGFAISFLLYVKKESYISFIKGRFFRIYPVYLFCLILGMATINLTPFIIQNAKWNNTVYFKLLGPLSNDEHGNLFFHFLSHLTLVHGLFPAKILPNANVALLPPGWSISLEWQYYLFAPLIALALCSSFRFFILIGVMFLGLRFADIWRNPHIAFLPAQLPLFLIGIASFHFYSYFSQSSGWRSAKLEVPFAALLVGVKLISWHSQALIIWVIVFGCIFVEGDGLFARFLVYLRIFLLNPKLQFLGKISYPIYLVHWPIIVLVLALVVFLRPTTNSIEAAAILLCIAMPLILFISYLLHCFVEAPCMKLGKTKNNIKNSFKKCYL